MEHMRGMVVWCLAMAGVAMLIPQGAFATARVLECGFTVNDTNSYDCRDYTEVFSGGVTKTNELTFTLAETVTTDNQDGSYDIDVDQSGMLWSEDGGASTSLSARSSAATVMTPAGTVTAQPDLKLLLNFSSILNETWDAGSIVDNSGLFVSTAVDVNDTWNVSHTTTPYGESATTVTATATLLEWTTLGGYNVAKIRYTWTEPLRQRRSSGTEAFLEGDLTCERIVYFAYAENLVVKIECTVTGTSLTLTEGSSESWLDFSETTTLLLD